MFLTLKFKNIVCFSVMVCVAFALSLTFAQGDDGVDVPIIMYHSVLKDNRQSPKYIVTPEQLERDLEFLSERGFTAITIGELIEYVYDKQPLPEKPIILTFDDGHYNNMYYAYPLMEKYGMKMVISVVGEYADTFSGGDESKPTYSYLTWAQIDELQKSDIVEIQNHTYALHAITEKRSGCKKNKGESNEEYERILREDLTKLQKLLKEKTGRSPTAFTYPFGGVSNASCEIIKELGFLASLSCKEGSNKITHDTECLYLLKRFIRPSGEDSKTYFEKRNIK